MYPDVSQKQILMGGSPSNKIGAYAEIQPSSIVFLAWYPKNPKMKTGQILQHFFWGNNFLVGNTTKKHLHPGGWDLEHYKTSPSPAPLWLRFGNKNLLSLQVSNKKKSSGKTMAELSGGFTRNWGSDGFGGETTCAYPIIMVVSGKMC